ncbi:MAG: oligosaccharide repeat unit polymerase [Tidjanibacter sp.]|nr:oligosaccharide repeat unit polymerase [Tidjanibacter sp.]
MNTTLGLVTLLVLILLVIRQIKVWKLRVFLSPGFYFGLLWSLGVVGILIFTHAELIPLDVPENMNELMSFIGFTGLVFLLLTKWGYSKINKEAICVNFTSWKVYKVLSIILLFAAVVEFFRLGGNLNMGAARGMVHDIQASRPTWINYATTIVPPISIWAGYKAMSLLVTKNKIPIVTAILLLLPLIANLIFSISEGGRVDFVYCFAYYLAGAALSLPIKRSFKNLKKPIIVIACGAVLLSAFISGVASQRAEYSKGTLSDKQMFFEQEYKGLSFLYGPVEYMTESFIGYQYRRDDAVDLNQLGYGRYTLNGFINWTVPFAGQLGIEDVSIAKSLGIYYNNQETYDFRRVAFFVTHSCYIPIVKDFGPRGAYLFIVILVAIAHYLFVWIQSRKHILFSVSFFFFLLFWEFWVKSNYYGTLSNSILVPLYGFLIIDIMNYVFTPRKGTLSSHNRGN